MLSFFFIHIIYCSTFNLNLLFQLFLHQIEIEKIPPKKIEKNEISEIIKFIWMDNKKPQYIVEKINSVYGQGTVSQGTVYN